MVITYSICVFFVQIVKASIKVDIDCKNQKYSRPIHFLCFFIIDLLKYFDHLKSNPISHYFTFSWCLIISVNDLKEKITFTRRITSYLNILCLFLPNSSIQLNQISAGNSLCDIKFLFCLLTVRDDIIDNICLSQFIFNFNPLKINQQMIIS